MACVCFCAFLLFLLLLSVCIVFVVVVVYRSWSWCYCCSRRSECSSVSTGPGSCCYLFLSCLVSIVSGVCVFLLCWCGVELWWLTGVVYAGICPVPVWACCVLRSVCLACSVCTGPGLVC